jgi:hypothetical protein
LFNIRILRILIGLLSLLITAGWSSQKAERKGFWASIQMGYGAVERSSDQEPSDQQDTFALSYILGGTPNPYLRLGLELNGWLLEPYDAWDPAKGVGISHTFLIAQLYPWRSRELFLKAGCGRSTFSDSHPDGFKSSGWGATIGLGYDIPLTKSVMLSAVTNYSQGRLGSVNNQVIKVTNRKYNVFDVRMAITFP